ncbi:MAG: type VI secretion system-associated protein TagF [Azospirillum sp.]|nr:type VI secretion system-associated protein TagF [Azospirillum sp.]
MSRSSAGLVGYCGKLPARGDYLSDNLPPDFLGPWQTWLDAAVGHARSDSGGTWPTRFAGSPVWRFALSAGVCGAAAMAGILMPSSDRVGRPYPLTLAATLDPGCDVAALMVAAADWFGGAEHLAGRARGEKLALDLDEFAAAVRGLGAPALTPPRPSGGRQGWRIGLESQRLPVAAYPALARDLASGLDGGIALWWTRGGGSVTPSLLVGDRLAEPAAAAALFEGEWSRHGWRDLSAD